MKFIKKHYKNLVAFLFFLVFCVLPIDVFALDLGSSNNDKMLNDRITFESNSTEADKSYIKLRNKLIDKLGREKTYNMLGFISVKEESMNIVDNTSNNLNSISPLGYDDNILTYSNSRSVTKGTMNLTMYKNLTQNIMDIWAEMTYKSGSSAGVSGLFNKYNDSLALSYDNTQVARTGSSISGAIVNHYTSSGGGYGSISYGSTYARIVYTVKPNTAGTNISNCHGNSIMLYAQRTSPVSDNIQITIGNGTIGVASGDYFTPNYLEYSGW